jgi:hypothetical protein
VSGNKARMQKRQEEQQLMMFNQILSMQRNSASEQAGIVDAQEAERLRIEAKVKEEEAQKQAAIRKKANAPFVRSSVVTSPFGLLSTAQTASRTFLGGG